MDAFDCKTSQRPRRLRRFASTAFVIVACLNSGCQTWQLQVHSPWLNYTLHRHSRPPGVSLDFRSGSQRTHLICCRWSLCNFISKRHYLLYATERYWCCICYLLDYANNRRSNRACYCRDVHGTIYFRSTKS